MPLLVGNADLCKKAERPSFSRSMASTKPINYRAAPSGCASRRHPPQRRLRQERSGTGRSPGRQSTGGSRRAIRSLPRIAITARTVPAFFDG
jgi:hypothetical protein